MRCLCYAKFSSVGSAFPCEFFSHLGAKWTCIEDTAKDSNEAVLHNLNDSSLLHRTIVFIAECKTIDQLTSALETLPGAGVSKIEVFPVPE